MNRITENEVKHITNKAIEAMEEKNEEVVVKAILKAMPAVEKALKLHIKMSMDASLKKYEKKLKYVAKRASAAQERYRVLTRNHEALLARQDKFIRHIPHVFAIMHDKYGKMDISPETYGKMAKDCLRYQMDEIVKDDEKQG
jgi:hypothetical protein